MDFQAPICIFLYFHSQSLIPIYRDAPKAQRSKEADPQITPISRIKKS
jgi:hypothetical protein